jgi:hypothetical protein
LLGHDYFLFGKLSLSFSLDGHLIPDRVIFVDRGRRLAKMYQSGFPTITLRRSARPGRCHPEPSEAAHWIRTRCPPCTMATNLASRFEGLFLVRQKGQFKAFVLKPSNDLSRPCLGKVDRHKT